MSEKSKAFFSFVLIALATAACAELGFTNRVVWRLPSPDGQLFAVCQEVPVFDGPAHNIRLERPDGTRVRVLYDIGDGDPCSEMAWSPDGRAIAVLSGHVARIRIVDVAWALAHPDSRTNHWSWRVIDLGSDVNRLRADRLRFVAPLTFEVRTCEQGTGPHLPNGRQDCGDAGRPRRVDIPLPIMTAAQ